MAGAPGPGTQTDQVADLAVVVAVGFQTATAAGILWAAVASLGAGTAVVAVAGAAAVAVVAGAAAAGSVPPDSVPEEQAVAQTAGVRSAAAVMEPRQMYWAAEKSSGVPTEVAEEGEEQVSSGPPSEEPQDVVLVVEDLLAVGSAEQRSSGWRQQLVFAGEKGMRAACQ